MATGREEDMAAVKFHHKCGDDITLLDNHTTAATVGSMTFESLMAGTSRPISSTVFSSVPVRQLHNNRFLMKTKEKLQVRSTHLTQIGVTRSDPGDLGQITAEGLPHTWYIEPSSGGRWEDSIQVDTAKVTKVTQQEGDVWCVEVTPGGQVYIYHNYSQPWGSPVFTLPPDTTQVWAVATLGYSSTIFVVQDCDAAKEMVRKLRAVQRITDAWRRTNRALRIFHYAPSVFDDMTAETKIDFISIILEISLNTNKRKLKDVLLTDDFISLLNEKKSPSDYLKIISIITKDGDLSQKKKYLKSMMQSWNFDIDGQKSTNPGFVCVLLTELVLCFNKNKKSQELFREFDAKLGPLVRQTLKYETTASINCIAENKGTPLLHAVNMYLPSVIESLLQHPGINVNITDGEGQTPLMILMEQDQINPSQLVNLIHLYTRHELFDPNVEDIKGNTVLFYMSLHLIPSDFLTFAFENNLEWDYSKRNKDGFRVLDFYLQQPNHKQAVSAKLMEVSSYAMSSSGIKRPEFRNARSIIINLDNFEPTAASYACTDNLFSSKKQMIEEDMVYDLTKAEKGKVFIISLTEFLVPWLSALPGYAEDKRNLSQFWSDVGFDVSCPKATGSDNHQLTAKEIELSVRSFADLLELEDQCAILIILTHGGEGFIYGSDGRKVYIRQMLQQFDNHCCIKMAGKPKIVIIQACQGDSFDMGVYQRAAPSCDYKVSAAVDETHLPLTSDMIVCVPAMPGYASFVKNESNAGSLFIKCLMKNFKQRVGTDDIYTILTMVNREMSRGGVDFYRSGIAEIQPHKQMSRFESCLTKLLFFFPAAGGKTGQDWK